MSRSCMVISEKKWAALKKRMEALKLSENDLSESFVLSSKKGGQNVNKTSSCVQLKHIPSNIEVKCQEYRSQAENRYHARKILCEKFEEITLGKSSPKQKLIMKIQKQKKRRKRKSDEKYESS